MGLRFYGKLVRLKAPGYEVVGGFSRLMLGFIDWTHLRFYGK